MKLRVNHTLGAVVLYLLVNGFDVHISFRPTQGAVALLAHSTEL